jgi:hypothetical protein
MIRTAEQTQATIVWVLSFHRCFDLNVATETNRLQIRSQDQWTIANSKNPVNPKVPAVKIKVVPTVTHHKKKCGFEPVVINPAAAEP